MKALTPSLTEIATLANRFWNRNKLWYRNRIKIKQLPAVSGRFDRQTSTETSSIACPFQTINLPQDVLEMIVSYFIYDISTLLACSVTCYSWHIAAVPHLHHTLTIIEEVFPWENGGHPWCRPLRESYNFCLLPFVKRLRMHLHPYIYSGFAIDSCTLRYFSALINLQELGMDHFHFPAFIQNVQQCFGHLAPTLRLLVLHEPKGSCRQILYFIGLFPNLQDLKLCDDFWHDSPEEEQDDTTDAELVPLSVPPLQGQLTIAYFKGEKLIEYMIAFFGGLRFRCLDLLGVECVRLVLGACSESLETLRLYPPDPYANDGAVCWHYDLSRNKSLRTLETTAGSMVALGASPDFLTTVLSTIPSSLPLDVVIIYRCSDVTRMTRKRPPSYVTHFTAGWEFGSALYHRRRFKEFREMYAKWEFRLVFCVDVLENFTEYTIQSLRDIVGWKTRVGG